MKTTLLVALVTLTAACTDSPSSHIRTSGMSASIIGTSTGSGVTEISTALQLGPTTYVDLEAPDAITAKSGADQLTLKRSWLFGMVTYKGSLKGDEEGKSITVAFDRGPKDTGAPSSVISMPAPFTITAPVANTLFVRGRDPIEVKWDNAGKADPMTIKISGDCILEGTRTVNVDTGSFVFPGSDFRPSENNEAKTCNLSIVVTRARAGVLDAAYESGGKVEGIQQRALQVRSAAP